MKGVLISLFPLLTCCGPADRPPQPPMPHYDMLPSEPRPAERRNAEIKPSSPDAGDIAAALNRAELAARELRDLVAPPRRPELKPPT